MGIQAAPRTRRVGVGIVELVPERHVDRSLQTLVENLTDRICALLVAIVAAAQMADVVTTSQALSVHTYVESNPVLRALVVRSPASAYAVKCLVVAAMVLLVLSRLRGRRAQFALAVAGAVSVVAPLLNLALLNRW